MIDEHNSFCEEVYIVALAVLVRMGQDKVI